MTKRTRIDMTPLEHVTAISYPAANGNYADISLILAHGAGANQTSSFMVHFATALAARGIHTITFNFIYSEEGRRFPDRNDKLDSCYRTVIEAFRSGLLIKDASRRKLVIGGKSMGDYVALLQVAATNGDGIAGLVFLGYPLHPPGRPETLRAKHLHDIRAPMLFVQGSRDAFGTADELNPIMKGLKAPADLYVVEGADHSFKVPKKAALSQEQVHKLVVDEILRWLTATASPRS